MRWFRTFACGLIDRGHSSYLAHEIYSHLVHDSSGLGGCRVFVLAIFWAIPQRRVASIFWIH